MQASMQRTAFRAGCSKHAFTSRPIRASHSRTFSRTARLSVAASAELDPDNASILVCGGGGVALHVTRKLKNMGSWVWHLQRSDVRRGEIEGMMAIVAKGDAMNKDDVQRVFDSIEEVDAVVSSLGGTVAEPQVDSEGNINIIEAAMKKGVKKFILVTSIGCGDSKDAPGQRVYDVLKPVLEEKNKAEAKLMSLKDKMTFVIIRPGGLVSEPATGTGMLTEDVRAIGSISREDVASLVVKALFSKKADNKVFSAVDKNKSRGPEVEVFQL